METNLPTVGLVGIGQLGLPLACNLLKSRYRVIGYRRSHSHEFVAAGGIAADSPASVVRQSDVVLMCLPSEEAQLNVLEGKGGVLGALKPSQLVIELGTYSRAFKVEQALRIQAAGGRVLEAEVSGSPPMVVQRRAALYLGGDAQVVEECQPLLDAITPNQFLLGEYGSAVAMKLIANYLLTIHTLAAAEAMNLGKRAGFDPRKVAEVIAQGAGGSAMFSLRAPMMAERRFQPAPGPFVTLAKYLELGSRMAQDLGCVTPLFTTAMPFFQRAIAQGMGDEDIAAVIKLIESDSEAQGKSDQ
ncbi:MULTISPECIES: NAD(P)-dependent oxidoreductase [Comamonadaceae]|uniref:NAD(P)-dependent oxidoreductase n=1 Tax=Comamonadaceae TaxID=80864 RepID=UPI00056E89CB|nr:NAD(P)-dependent oxidoreductase [Xenophilus azovorans]